MRTYEETLNYLFRMLPMYQRLGKTAFKKDLSNTIELLQSLDNPHLKIKTVHIAGTNGKGTSAHGLAAILQLSGYKTGLYTSPHLKNFTERIRIDGKEISQEFVIDFVERVEHVIEEIAPSFFEVTVAMAFTYFAEQMVDIAVIETGLGGRLDSTNVITPEVSLITNIGMDHTDLLGDTLEKIAGEKAGIIKNDIPVVIGEFQKETFPVFQKIANDRDAELILSKNREFSEPFSALFPLYFIRNVPGICSVVDVLVKKGYDIQEKNIKLGLDKVNELTGLKGRLQVLQEKPLVIADVSHNKEGMEVLFQQISKLKKNKLHIIFGTVMGKDLNPILDVLPDNSIFYWTQSSVPRSQKAVSLRNQAEKSGLEGNGYDNVNTAIKKAIFFADTDDVILITGSTFIIADINSL